MAAESIGVEITMEPVYVDPSTILYPRQGMPPEEPTPPEVIIIPEGHNPVILNIETLGLDPTESRIISIGYYNPQDFFGLPSVLMDESEEALLRNFLAIFERANYNQIIGYNTSFDFRYILARAMIYRLGTREFQESYVTDLMDELKKGKSAYIPSTQKATSLEAWTKLYFGTEKPFTDEEMQKYYLQGEWDQVREFTYHQVQATYDLWALWNSTIKTSIGRESAAAGVKLTPNITEGEVSCSLLPASTPPPTDQAAITNCKFCLQQSTIPPGRESIICPVCGNTVTR